MSCVLGNINDSCVKFWGDFHWELLHKSFFLVLVLTREFVRFFREKGCHEICVIICGGLGKKLFGAALEMIPSLS